jgi:hypothetical protein
MLNVLSGNELGLRHRRFLGGKWSVGSPLCPVASHLPSNFALRLWAENNEIADRVVAALQ